MKRRDHRPVQSGGYYRSIQRTFLVHTLLWPLVPMLLVSGLIVYVYDAQFSALVEAATHGSLLADAAERLFRVRLAAMAAIAAVVILVAMKVHGLSYRMARRVADTHAEKQRLSEQMFHTAKLASVGELAAGVAHEINNPLAVMIEEAGWIKDLLAENAVADPGKEVEIQRALEQIRVQGARCKDITSKLLNFARQGDDDTSELNINQLLDDLLSVIGRRAQRRGVAVGADIAHNLPPVTASYGEVQQVLFNLINNALDAMDPGGGELHISAARDGDEVVLTVEDTGQGIAEDRLQNVFDPFYTTKPVGSGTGLGLSICYGLVRKWGGRIRIESSVGEGTRVWFTMPLKDARGAGVGPATPDHRGADAASIHAPAAKNESASRGSQP